LQPHDLIARAGADPPTDDRVELVCVVGAREVVAKARVVGQLGTTDQREQPAHEVVRARGERDPLAVASAVRVARRDVGEPVPVPARLDSFAHRCGDALREEAQDRLVHRHVEKGACSRTAPDARGGGLLIAARSIARSGGLARGIALVEREQGCDDSLQHAHVVAEPDR
jgi:hypothetical protein